MAYTAAGPGYADPSTARVIMARDIPGIIGVQEDDVFVVLGYNPDVAAGTEEDLWIGSGIYTGWLQTAVELQVRAGGDALDDAAGDGARKVTLYGLDENWARVSEEITLAGASASAPTTTTFIRLHRAVVTEVGLYGAANEADILIETADSPGDLIANLQAGASKTQLGLYSVPAGFTAYIGRISISSAGSKETLVRLWKRENADVVAAPFGPKVVVHSYADLSATVQDYFSDAYLGPFPEKTDLWLSAVGAPSGSAVSGEFIVVCVAN